ncbi:MAG: lytic transglycosylase domain-containing protein [Campylobacterota bacterium]|nr:lytic transglycosylase domain-containing protein [Campylobacterota bacterium]
MSSRNADKKEITLEYINSKESGRAKNFLIWQYLKQDITPTQADKAYKQVTGNDYKIYNRYIKKTKNIDILKKLSCQKKTNLFDIKEYKCFKSAYSLTKALKLTKHKRKKLLSKLKLKKSKEILQLFDEPYSSKTYIKYTPEATLSFFNRSRTFRRKNLNIDLDKKLINSLSTSWRISKFVKHVVNDDKLGKLQISLLNLETKNLNSQTIFFLALNHLRYKQENKSIEFFELSYKKAKKKIDKDKNLFWLYKTTKKDKYLKKLLASSDINIYTLYAYELSDKKQKNYFTTVKTGFFDSSKTIFDPFIWNEIKKEIKDTPKNQLFDLAENYSQDNMIPVKTFILEKAYKYNIHGFVMPYDEHLKELTNDKKALVYALMRQESNFIPAALSRSFALGLMQLMPFLVDALAKDFKEEITYNEMFIPKNNLKYALKHLKWMEKSLYHPLFMAYAYNGGMGFLKRHLLSTGKFSSGKHEPFLSMELMANTESREYGKKVLANYVMYKRILGEEVSIITLFDKLINPKHTDRFREQD